jgi:hypothetical protein
MGKLGGIILLSTLALTGCSGPASAAPTRPQVQPAFAGVYAHMTDAEMADVEQQLCEHFKDGFTVDDAARVQGELFGATAGEQLRAVAQYVEARGC